MTMNFHLVNITLIKQIHDNYMVIRVFNTINSGQTNILTNFSAERFSIYEDDAPKG